MFNEGNRTLCRQAHKPGKTIFDIKNFRPVRDGT